MRRLFRTLADSIVGPDCHPLAQVLAVGLGALALAALYRLALALSH